MSYHCRHVPSSISQRRHYTQFSDKPRVEKLTVFGAGLMGAGIAQVGAQNGLKVSVNSNTRS